MVSIFLKRYLQYNKREMNSNMSNVETRPPVYIWNFIIIHITLARTYTIWEEAEKIKKGKEVK